jgi:hypothetical protein
MHPGLVCDHIFQAECSCQRMSYAIDRHVSLIDQRWRQGWPLTPGSALQTSGVRQGVVEDMWRGLRGSGRRFFRVMDLGFSFQAVTHANVFLQGAD